MQRRSVDHHERRLLVTASGQFARLREAPGLSAGGLLVARRQVTLKPPPPGSHHNAKGPRILTGASIISVVRLLLGGHPVGLRGAVHDVIHRLLRLGGGAEYRAAVFLHRFKPSFDIGRALIEFRLHPDLRAKHAISDLRDQFLKRVSLTVIEPA